LELAQTTRLNSEMNEYPLHKLVFENDLNALNQYLKQESAKV